jgi:hypothetical protein
MRGIAAVALAVVALAAPAKAGPSTGVLVVERLVGDQLELFSVSPDGTHAHRLTRNADTDYQPSWSPDGRRIVAVRYGGRGSITVRERSGRLLRSIATQETPSTPGSRPTVD